MRSQHPARGTRLASSLLMALIFSGAISALFLVHAGGSDEVESAAAGLDGSTEQSAAQLTKAGAPGSLRLRMTLPYVPSGGARATEQEI